MKTTYTGTLFHPVLTEAVIKLYIYEGVKYEDDTTDPISTRYTGVTAWDIVTGEDAQEIEAETDSNSIDEYHEYLVLHFENGETATFRNSHVDMFVL